MADAKIAPNTLEKVIAGEAPLNTFFGLTKDQIGAIAAMGFNLYEQGKTKDAETVFTGLIALDGSYPLGYAGLGAVALSKEPPELDKAYENLKKAVELDPKDPSIMANLGETLLRQAKFDEAAKTFEKALALDPQKKDPGANRARAIIGGMEVVLSEAKKLQAAGKI